MPTAIVLTLRPRAASNLPAHLGRASHAALLGILAERDANLAQQLHDQQGLKPFAVSDLLGAPPRRDGRVVDPGHTYSLRWSGLSSELDTHLRALAVGPPAEIELDGTRFTVEHATSDPTVHPWAGAAEWDELVALERVGREAPPHRFALEFFSPTTFRSNGRNIPLPLPELVFGSLLERWNSIAPLALPIETRRFAGECLVLGRYTLAANWMPLFDQGGETAFTGRAIFTAVNRDRYYLHCCTALLRLAFFCGVGAKTSMGFGMTRWEQRA